MPGHKSYFIYGIGKSDSANRTVITKVIAAKIKRVSENESRAFHNNAVMPFLLYRLIYFITYPLPCQSDFPFFLQKYALLTAFFAFSFSPSSPKKLLIALPLPDCLILMLLGVYKCRRHQLLFNLSSSASSFLFCSSFSAGLIFA